MVKIYRKITAIQAEQFDGSQKMIKKYGIEDSADSGYNDSDWEDEGLCIPTKEGYLRINNGDWISTGFNGDHWLISDEVFKKTYAELPVIPQFIADWIEECKRNNQAIGAAMDQQAVPTSVRNYFRSHITTAQLIEVQNIFARAWLDGYRLEAQHE